MALAWSVAQLTAAQTDSLQISAPYDFFRIGATSLAQWDSVLSGKKSVHPNHSLIMNRDSATNAMKSTFRYDYRLFSESKAYHADFRFDGVDKGTDTPLLSVFFYPESKIVLNGQIIPGKSTLAMVRKTFGRPFAERYPKDIGIYYLGYRLYCGGISCEVLLGFTSNDAAAKLRYVSVSQYNVVHLFLNETKPFAEGPPK